MKTPDRRALRRIELKNLLSFGPDSPALELENLNILIGANGSGKSNLIEAISLLRATPVSAAATKSSLRGVVTRGGGVHEWIGKGGDKKTATVKASLSYPTGKSSLEHSISFHALDRTFRLEEERIKLDEQFSYYFGPLTVDGAWINLRGINERQLSPGSVDTNQSILTQIRDAEIYPEMAYLAETYERVRIYQDWTFGRKTIFRDPQSADTRSDRLEEDFSNIGLILSRLQNVPKIRKAIKEGLKDLYADFTDLQLNIRSNGFVDIFFHEGEISVPAKRLSDGTLRYLCLLAILCDPEPPPLICIEEPELGLHPDIIPKLADLLVEASERTQLIVTTHSDVLVDCMTDRVQTVVVCEKKEGQTVMRRLDQKELKPWLEEYRLGQLWTDGHLGGNRW